MNRLTKFIQTATLSVVLSLVFMANALAASFWKVDISTPATQTARTFNVQYTTLSTNSSDVIDVSLYQNGALYGTQVTIPAGDSGAFAVTVPNEGVYSYYIVANNGGDSKTTATKQVTVTTPPTQVNTVYTTSSSATSGASNGSGSSINGSATTNATTNTSASGSTGTTNGASSTNNGEVNASGNANKDNKPGTLGESKNNQPKKSNDNSKVAWTLIGAGALSVLLYAGRGWVYRDYNGF